MDPTPPLERQISPAELARIAQANAASQITSTKRLGGFSIASSKTGSAPSTNPEDVLDLKGLPVPD